MKNTVLILAPHTDDGEFGCGGTIHKMISEGYDVHYYAFSDCKQTFPEGQIENVLRKELYKATKTLGIPNDQVTLLDFEVRRFGESRQEILDTLIEIRATINPDIVFVPGRNDIHQDHQVLTNEAIRAFKHCSIYGYEFPWNLIDGLPSNVFFVLSKENLDVKVNSIQCYESQKGRGYAEEEYIRALAFTRGKRIQVKYAETFEAIRIICR